MPKTIHVTVTYSVHVEDDTLTDKQARIYAQNLPVSEWKIFDVTSRVFEKWKEEKPKLRKGIGSY